MSDLTIRVFDEKFQFTRSSSPEKLCFRLVHDQKNVVLFEENDCLTETGLEMFCGTETECRDEIDRLGLVIPAKESDNLIIE